MKKTLFTAALACVLSLGGLVLSAADAPTYNALRMKENRTDFLLRVLSVPGSSSEHATELTSNFAVKQGDTVIPLSERIVEASDPTQPKFASLGSVNLGETFQIGTLSDNKFTPLNIELKTADPNYYAAYSADSFYQLDFSEDPFDGLIELAVVGTPLPASTTTLIVALFAGAAFLLYRNRKQQHAIGTEQA